MNETGISLIQLAKQMDCGNILSQTTLNLKNKKYFYHELESLLANLAADESRKVLQNFSYYSVLSPIPQLPLSILNLLCVGECKTTSRGALYCAQS